MPSPLRRDHEDCLEASRSLSWRRGQQSRLLDQVDLVEDEDHRPRWSFSCSTCPGDSASKPVSESITSAIRSASFAPAQAAATIARSRRRFGSKMPGVSTSRICAAP